MSQIVDFYTKGGKDNKGRTLHDMLTWDDEKLERTHDYIQWMFPLNEPSRFNPDAPVLSERDIKTLRAKGYWIITSAKLFHKFLQRGTVKGTPQFWLTPGNHNQLRITRLIKCLMLMEWDMYAEYIHSWVMKHNEDGGLDGAIPYWDKAIVNESST